MTSLKILHTADVHLGTKFPALGEYASQRGKDFLETFSTIVKTALDQKVDLFFVAGDLFDSPHPSSNVFGYVKAEFEKLIQAHIPIILIPGTHDNIMASDHIYRHPFFDNTILFKNPILHKPLTLTVQGLPIHLYGMAYHSTVSTDYLNNMKRRDLPGLHVGLLHGSIQGSPEWKIYTKDFPLTTEDLFNLNLDYCALGHYHNAITYHQHGRIKASYPGTPEGKRFRESGARMVHLIDISEKGEVQLTPLPVNTKTLLEKEIDLFTLPKNISLIKELSKLRGERIIARIILKGITEDILDIEKIRADCAPYFSYLEIIDETTVMDSHWIKRLEKENTIRGFFTRRMKEKIGSVSDPHEKNIMLSAFKEVLQSFEKKGEA